MFFFFFFEELYHLNAIQQAFKTVCLDKMLADGYFAGTTGYGYDDPGRDAVEKALDGVVCEDVIMNLKKEQLINLLTD